MTLIGLNVNLEHNDEVYNNNANTHHRGKSGKHYSMQDGEPTHGHQHH